MIIIQFFDHASLLVPFFKDLESMGISSNEITYEEIPSKDGFVISIPNKIDQKQLKKTWPNIHIGMMHLAPNEQLIVMNHTVFVCDKTVYHNLTGAQPAVLKKISNQKPDHIQMFYVDIDPDKPDRLLID